MPHGEHHINQRERIHQKYESFPHKDKRIRFLDNLTMINSVVMPLTTIPQIYKIYVYQSAQAISLSMWVLYNISCLIMLIYGIVHRVKPIIVLNLLWIIANISIIVGVILYS